LFGRSFSSITFHGDNTHHWNNNNNNTDRAAQKHKRQEKNQRQSQRYKRRGQQQQYYSRIVNNSRAAIKPRDYNDESFVFGTIQEAQESMQDLLDKLTEIDDSFPFITVQSIASDNSNAYLVDAKGSRRRAQIFQKAGEVFDALVRSVENGVLSPSRKHGKELSQLAECLLFVCAQQTPYVVNDKDDETINNKKEHYNDLLLESDEVSGAIREVLRVLEVDWNLDVQHRHYEQAIAGACIWKDWNLASELFEKQIDPNAGGSPVVLSIENPLPLYAMAQQYLQEFQQQQQDRDANNDSLQPCMVAEHVMDAVQRLVMVSPQDQNTYVLAAGNALGYAGRWREFNDYRKSTMLSQQYGASLTAAVLRACLVNGDYDKALSTLVEEGILSLPEASEDEESENVNESRKTRLEEEWQWGGVRDRMDPLIRDLTMQVLGGVSTLVTSNEATGSNQLSEDQQETYDFCNSRLAMELYRQSREENVTISPEALVGVVEACERDKNWRGAFSVLRTVLEEEESILYDNNIDDKGNHQAPWIVPSERLSIFERDNIGVASASSDETNSMAVVPDLGPLLASVMRNCNSTSNFGLALFGLQLFRSHLNRLDIDSSSSSSNNNHSDGNSAASSPEDKIIEMLSQLNFTGSPEDYDEILIASMVALSGLRCNKHAMRLYEKTSEMNPPPPKEGIYNDNSTAASLVYRYASLNQKCTGTLVLGNPWLSAHTHINQLIQTKELVQNILRGRSINYSSLAERQREGTEEILSRAMDSCTKSHQPELSLYLLEWMEDSVFKTNNAASAGDYSDSLTAETIMALRWTKNLNAAYEKFEGILEKHSEDDLVRWRKTIVAGLATMVVSGRGNDAVKFFGLLNVDTRSTACYTTIGRHMSKMKDWKKLINLYRDATDEGYASEELSLLAMQAVTSTKVDNRLRILRAIVDDCASNVGVDSKRWTMTKYWQLKRMLGFYHARLLMWWNDEQRAPLDEVNYAIKEFYNEKANGMRPKNDVVRAIVASASKLDSLGLDRESGYETVPRSAERWSNLLDEVLEAVKESRVRYDPNFVDSVVMAYNSLGNSNACVEYILDVMEVDRTRLRKSTLLNAKKAAEEEEAYGLLHDIEMMLSQGSMPQDVGVEE